MKDAISKLLSICSSDIAEPLNNSLDPISLGQFVKGAAYISLMRKRNGFYGFESALHVFPLLSAGDEIDVQHWNEGALWSDYYKEMTKGCFFFAEDIFGGQFSLKEDGIYTFDPETGESSKLCDSLIQWCEAILDDYDYLTGYSLAHEWQKKYGKIPHGHRLVPKIPFVLGGEFSVENLLLKESYIAMRYRAEIALKFKGVPDGGRVDLIID